MARLDADLGDDDDDRQGRHRRQQRERQLLRDGEVLAVKQKACCRGPAGTGWQRAAPKAPSSSSLSTMKGRSGCRRPQKERVEPAEGYGVELLAQRSALHAPGGLPHDHAGREHTEELSNPKASASASRAAESAVQCGLEAACWTSSRARGTPALEAGARPVQQR